MEGQAIREPEILCGMNHPLGSLNPIIQEEPPFPACNGAASIVTHGIEDF
jgi:hypothetical protein